MGSLRTEKHFIPTVDMRAILSPTASAADRRATVEAMQHAATTYGFFNLVGHGITPALQQKAFAASKLFFALPDSERVDIHVSKAVGRSFRGWEPPLIQQHHGDLLPDTKETFIVGREVPADHPDSGSFMTGPNLWPAQLPRKAFRDVVMAYHNAMVALAGTLIRVLVEGLPEEWGCSSDVLDGLLHEPAVPMRFLHYGPVKEKNPRQFGVAAHTDFSAITILLQQLGTEGLQVWYPPTEDWIPVPVVEDAFVINIGDLMQKYTGGHYRSAMHRVVTCSDPEKHRYSIAFFLDGNLQFKTKPLDGKGEETEVGEYVRSRLMDTLGTRGPLL